jgi:hypothetical protein
MDSYRLVGLQAGPSSRGIHFAAIKPEG